MSLIGRSSSSSGVYPSVQKELFELAKLFYQPKVIVHHYRGIAKVVSGYSPENNSKNEISVEPIKLKKWFYLLRSLLSAYWTVKTGDIPPMELDKLIKILTVEEQKAIEELVEFKSDKDEHFTWVPTEAMQHLVIFLWQETNVQLAKRTVPDNDILNNWFRKKLDEADH